MCLEGMTSSTSVKVLFLKTILSITNLSASIINPTTAFNLLEDHYSRWSCASHSF